MNGPGKRYGCVMVCLKIGYPWVSHQFTAFSHGKHGDLKHQILGYPMFFGKQYVTVPLAMVSNIGEPSKLLQLVQW